MNNESLASAELNKFLFLEGHKLRQVSLGVNSFQECRTEVFPLKQMGAINASFPIRHCVRHFHLVQHIQQISLKIQ